MSVGKCQWVGRCLWVSVCGSVFVGMGEIVNVCSRGGGGVWGCEYLNECECGRWEISMHFEWVSW